MKKEFVPYEPALDLRELGFNEKCLGRYDPLKVLVTISRPENNSYYKGSVPSFLSAPLYQQAFRWFREKYGYDVSIVRRTGKAYKFEIQKLVYEGNDYFFSGFSFDSHQEAELECLKKLIEIVKNK